MTVVEPIRNKNDIKNVEHILEQQSLRNLLIFAVGTNCGLRISDILGLNVDDVRGKSYIELTEKKTGKYKRFPINAKLKPLFEALAKDREGKDPFFETMFQNRMNRYTAYKIIKTACIEAGVQERVGTHTLRKTFGYHHYQMFKDVAMLQKIFNHSSPQITLRYIGIEQKQIYESYTSFIL